jgi:hypothetical protein
MKQSDGFDHIRAYQERMRRQERDDSFRSIVSMMFCMAILCAAIVAVSAGCIPHG